MTGAPKPEEARRRDDATVEHPTPISTKRERIAKLARENPTMAFTSLAHHIDINWLRKAYELTRKDGAVGVDGQTAKDYAANLEANLQSLLDRAKSGRYRAPAVRRAHIPKGHGEMRPLGIPTFEDKILQRAVLMVLEAVYEQDFLDCSYGFRPGRSPHDALAALRRQAMAMRGCRLLEVDLRKYFDTVDRGCLREILRRRVRDGVLLRLIGKWLNAGVLEKGQLSYPESGTPQGGVISPILANIYLHWVLDVWFEAVVKPRLKGRAFLVRFADDFVIGFECEEDAHRVRAVLEKRFDKFGLRIHPDKTRLIDFRRPPRGGAGGGHHDDGSFDFLGFTHHWGRTRRGSQAIWRKTARTRLARAIKSIATWCRQNRHLRVSVQHQMLCRKLRGHYQYYGVTGNWRSLACLLRAVERLWRKWLDRRSQRRHMPWPRFKRLLSRHALPTPALYRSAYARAAKP